MPDTLPSLDRTGPGLGVLNAPAGVPVAAARELLRSSLSANTRTAYLGALTRLDAALKGQPLTDQALAAYLGRLFEVGRSAATAKLAVAAVRFQARLTGGPSPVGPLSERALRGYVRQEGVGAVVYLGRPTLERLKAWVGAAGITEGALFRQVGKGGRVTP